VPLGTSPRDVGGSFQATKYVEQRRRLPSGGGEIGRAQALQALAAGLEPHPDMNPVLLKPESDLRAQIVVQGEVAGHLGAVDYLHEREYLRTAIDDSFRRLRQRYDLVLVEGAGSPAETNL